MRREDRIRERQFKSGTNEIGATRRKEQDRRRYDSR